MSEFTSVTEISRLQPGHRHIVRLQGKEIAIFNLNGEFFALDNVCPHKEGPLGAGLIAEGQVFCPMHGWQFDIKTGACLTRPDCPVKTYRTQVHDGQIQVCLTDS